MNTTIQLKRVYGTVPEAADGFRVLVDRLWPRGLTREQVHADFWDRDVAPSDALRQWFHADPAIRWPEFVRRYRAELADSAAFAALVSTMSEYPRVTLLYGSRDALHNEAVVLQQAAAEALSQPAAHAAAV